jgi:dienelactone hydrolase
MRIASKVLHRDQDGVSGFIAYPATAARRPGVLVLHHANGVTADLKTTAADLARLGYATLVPNLYHMLGVAGDSHIGRGAELQQRLNDNEFLRVIGDAWRFLARRADVDPTRTGIIAHSMGGRLAIPFAADTPELRALVLYYPSVRDEIETALRPRHAFDLARTIKCPSMLIYGGRDHIASACPPRLRLARFRRLSTRDGIDRVAAGNRVPASGAGGAAVGVNAATRT